MACKVCKEKNCESVECEVCEKLFCNWQLNDLGYKVCCDSCTDICFSCDGTGVEYEETCLTCAGTGKVGII